MPSAAQMKSLLNSHYIGDEEHFNTVALQIAASEARQGHQKLADEVKYLVDTAKSGRLKKKTLSFNRPNEELRGLLSVSVFAGELWLSFFQVLLDGLISRYMGKTASNLRLIFVYEQAVI
jgi:hypothetical protein